MPIQLGCFCRPWNKLSREEFLLEVQRAGYDYAGFMRLKGDLLVKPGMTDDEVLSLTSALADHDLSPSTALVTHSLADGVEAAIAEAFGFVDALAAVGCTHYLSCGTAAEEQYAALYEVLREASAYASDKGVLVTLKPHGGISALNADLLRALEIVDHPNFAIYFDPGNIIYYTGGDPLENLPELAPHVAGICVKDEIGGVKGDVNIEPGTGDVDFEAVFDVLLEAGFDGPACVECLGGETIEDIGARAGRVHERLLGWTGR